LLRELTFMFEPPNPIENLLVPVVSNKFQWFQPHLNSPPRRGD
jgi:hypothetical protein